LARQPRFRRTRGGFTLVEMIVAISLAAVSAFLMILVLQTVGKASTTTARYGENLTTMDNLADELESSAGSASAIFTTASCPAAGCAGVRFYQMDVAGNRHYWGYSYNAATKLLTKCTSYAATTSDYTPTCAGTTSTLALDSFTVQPINATTLASQMGVTFAGGTNVSYQLDSSLRDPLGLVTSGNRLMRVTYYKAPGMRTVDLIQGGTPLSVSVITHHNAAPQVGAVTGPGTIGEIVGSTSSETYTAPNIGQYAPYLGANGGWTVTACTGTGSAVPLVTGDSGNNAGVNVTGVTTGQCVFDVNIGTQSYPVTVTIGAVPTPAPGPTATPTPSGSSGGVPTPDPTGPIATPTPCFLCASPAPTPIIPTCTKTFGAPSFYTPPNDSAPDLTEMYDAVSSGGTNPASARTPNGNTMYGFWDHWPGNASGNVKGSVLFAENTDCTVTMIIGTDSYSGGTKDFHLSLVFNVPNNSALFASDFLPASGGGACFSAENLAHCGTPQSPTAQVYQPLSLESSGSNPANWGFDMWNAPDVDDNQSPFVEADSSLGCQNPSSSDWGGGTRYTQEELSSNYGASVDTVSINYHGTSSYNLARVLFKPYNAIQYIPTPSIAHVILYTSDQQFCYFPEGSEYWGTGPSSSVIGPSGLDGSGAPASQTKGLLLSGYIPGGYSALDRRRSR
jgi:prepilin-type N-terminal cleavage/methylation domain-containing protein